MAKRMTYKTLVKKIEDGYAEVNAWGHITRTDQGGESYADVTFFNTNGTSRRESVELVKIPQGLEG